MLVYPPFGEDVQPGMPVYAVRGGRREAIAARGRIRLRRVGEEVVDIVVS